MDLKFKSALLILGLLSYPERCRERRDFSPALLCGAGRPEGQNLEALVALCG
jgi:hypothetical protein